MLEIRGVRRGIYAYDGKCDGTYIHIFDGARVPSGDVAIERGCRTKKILYHSHLTTTVSSCWGRKWHVSPDELAFESPSTKPTDKHVGAAAHCA